MWKPEAETPTGLGKDIPMLVTDLNMTTAYLKGIVSMINYNILYIHIYEKFKLNTCIFH